MTVPSQDSTIELRLPAATSGARSSHEIENVVLHLFDQTRARLSSYVLAFGLPHHDAEDIVQETFLSLFHHLERGRPRWNLHGWLFRVAHNLALKRRQAQRRLAQDLNHEEALARHPDPGHNAEEHLAFNQVHQRLRSIFEVLPEQDQRCLMLRAEGLKYREIAKILGISLGTVSLSLSRSLAKMSRATEGEE
jgi:RNA polymerase sigma-70 factor (ECF subfamily)